MTKFTLTIDEQDMPAVLIGLSAYKGFLREQAERGGCGVTVGGITIGVRRENIGAVELEVARVRRDLVAQRDAQITDAA